MPNDNSHGLFFNIQWNDSDKNRKCLITKFWGGGDTGLSEHIPYSQGVLAGGFCPRGRSG